MSENKKNKNKTESRSVSAAEIKNASEAKEPGSAGASAVKAEKKSAGGRTKRIRKIKRHHKTKAERKTERQQKKNAKTQQKNLAKAASDKKKKSGKEKALKRERQKNRLWIKHAEKTVKKVNALKDAYQKMSDEELKGKTGEFKERIEKGEKLDSLLPEAFAAVREASMRTIGLFHYDVQIMGGLALHEGKIAELKTGEGKTLLATLPAYLHALAGKGVHVVTVNDYLAQRDAENMGLIHRFLGLSVGVVTSESSAPERRSAYACDITYVTNTELGFDYLRDNMAVTADQRVLRGLEYAIIDEADSVLIDEARTPLIISGEGTDVSKIYMSCDIIAKSMEKGTESKEFNRIDAMLDEAPIETGDFIVHEKDKLVTLTESGVRKIEKAFALRRYSDSENVLIQHTMDLALKANYLMKKGKDYIVRDGEVLIVDEFTGRIMQGRQYSDGLHQAIEAKEGVEIRQETQTVATTTYQSFFMKFAKICGMTGTAYTERKEFKSTYHMKTVVIPTNKPMIRVDHQDVIYLSKKGKFDAVVKDVVETHKKGQPILLGTATVTTSEYVSVLLKKAGIPHTVLNAKQDAHEAEIIAQAGRFGAVTVATNMAGRGTDIILEPDSVKAGGLKVIGTERHESQRIDNQLRGRAGRQGDPGESIFYLSAEDDMMRLYGSDRMKNILSAGGYRDDEPITSRMLVRAIHRAQQKVEDNNFAMRKNVLDYDRIDDRQRTLIYGERNNLLDGGTVTDQVRQCFENAVEAMIKDSRQGHGHYDTDTLISRFNEMTNQEFVIPESVKKKPLIRSRSKSTKLHMIKTSNKSKKKHKLFALAGKSAKPAKGPKLSEKRLKKALMASVDSHLNDFVFTSELSRESFERSCLFSAVDTAWMEQLRALEFLRNGIFYLSYAQLDPKSMYASEAFDLYTVMKKNIYTLTSYLYFNRAQLRKKKAVMHIRDAENGVSSDTITIRARKDGAAHVSD